MMKKLMIIALLTFVASSNVMAGEYWTVNITGLITTTSGRVAINIGNGTPIGPNPADAVWAACNSNWIYFDTDADGHAVEDKYVDRMLMAATSAFKTGTKVRVSITRKSSNNSCYTSQIFDIGT
jgi:hypothetical protein